MTTPVAISVIVSTRNRAAYLPEVLRTLAEQAGETPYEVIVIDNGSTDETPALLSAWCARDRRFRTAREDRPGLSRGKNAGILLARAPLLLFTDDDVRVDPRWVASYRTLFDRHPDPYLIAGGPIVPMPHDLGPWPDWFGEPALAEAGLLDHRTERALRSGEYVWGGNMAVPRRVFDQLGGWDESAGLQGEQRVTKLERTFFEDTELQDRLRKAGGVVWFCPGAAVHHRVDRRTITPRRVLATAFTRGRNDVWSESLPVWHDVRLVPRRNALVCSLALVGSLLSWGAWSVVFRLTRHRAVFERVRRAAFAAGRRLDSLRAGRESVRLFQGAGKLAFPMRGWLLRLTPDVP
jgi:glucosyl-dolichyl phosphate glucuronosyltransferase